MYIIVAFASSQITTKAAHIRDTHEDRDMYVVNGPMEYIYERGLSVVWVVS